MYTYVCTITNHRLICQSTQAPAGTTVNRQAHTCNLLCKLISVLGVRKKLLIIRLMSTRLCSASLSSVCVWKFVYQGRRLHRTYSLMQTCTKILIFHMNVKKNKKLLWLTGCEEWRHAVWMIHGKAAEHKYGIEVFKFTNRKAVCQFNCPCTACTCVEFAPRVEWWCGLPLLYPLQGCAGYSMISKTSGDVNLSHSH